jgi:hypothetical protein
MIYIHVARGRWQRKPCTVTASSTVRLAANPTRSVDTADAANPLPAAGDVTAASLTNGSTHIRVALDNASDTVPQLLASLSVQLRAQDIVAKLANWNVRLSGTATGMQRCLRRKTV